MLDINKLNLLGPGDDSTNVLELDCILVDERITLADSFPTCVFAEGFTVESMFICVRY